MPEKTPHQNRIRETLGRLYEHHPPHFREYLRRYQEDPTSRVFAPLAESYRRLGRVEEAIEICKEGMKHHPDFHGGRVALARCYIDKKLFVEAKDALEQVSQVAPENLLAQRLLGDCYLSLKDKRSALHRYKMAALLSPEDVALHEKIHQLEKSLETLESLNEEGFDDVTHTDAGPMMVRASAGAVSEAPEQRASAEAMGSGTAEAESVVPNQSPVTQNLNFPVEANAEQEPWVEEPHEAELRHSQIDALLGVEEEEDGEESFKVESVEEVFKDDEGLSNPEITTQTLGALYFSQGQFEKSLRIFEKLAKQRATSELSEKISECRSRLGVDGPSRQRQRNIDILSQILKRNKEASSQIYTM